VRPSLAAGAFDGSAHPIAVVQPVIARHLVAVARMEGAEHVAHGASGEDRARLETLVSSLAPDLVMHALHESAAGDGISQHLWARTVAVAPSAAAPANAYSRTAEPAACAAHPAVVDIAFDRAVPVAVNGVALELDALIEVVDTIAGDHGVGRSEARLPDGTRMIIEAPAAVVLATAARELADAGLPQDLRALRQQTADAYGQLVADGKWHTPTRAALDAFTASVAAALTGSVRLSLAAGECVVLGRHVQQPASLATATL
jgi:argininosuccinate synthase